MKKQTSINIFGAEQRLVFLGGASGDWGGGEVSKAEKPTEGNVCYVPGDTKAEGTRTVEAHEKKLLQTAKRQGLERIDETLENFQVTEKLKKEGEEAKAKINSVTTWDNRQTINRTVDDFERLATIETDKFPLTPAIARARAIRKIDVAVKAETDPSKAVLLAYDAGKVKALLGNAKTPEDVTKIMERFGVDAAAGVQKQEWTPDTLQKVTQDTTGIAPGGGQPAIEAAEVAATSAPGMGEKPETAKETVLTDKRRVDITLGYINGVRKGQHLDITPAGFKDYFGVSLKSTEPSEVVTAIKKKQEELNTKGAKLEKLDGILGPKTYAAIKQYDDAGFKKLTQGMIVAKQKETAFQTLENLQNQILQGRNNIRQYDNDARVSATTAGESLATLQKSTLNTPGNTLEHADKSITYADATEGYFQKAQAEIVKIENAIKTIPNASLTDGMRAMQHESQQLRNDIVEAAYSARMSAKQATEFAAERSREVYKQALDQRKTTPDLVTSEVVQGALTNYKLWQSKSSQQKRKLTAAEKEKNDLQKIV